jgi:hypothetical protein
VEGSAFTGKCCPRSLILYLEMCVRIFGNVSHWRFGNVCEVCAEGSVAFHERKRHIIEFRFLALPHPVGSTVVSSFGRGVR